MLNVAVPGATFLLNAPYAADQVWDKLPYEVQKDIIDKKLKVYTIDAINVARETGMGAHINVIMQTCFFAISGVLPRDQAIAEIKKAIKKTYGRKGDEVVQKNYRAVDQTLANLFEVKVPAKPTSKVKRPATVSPTAPEFIQDFTATIMRGQGDDVPVSAMPVDGTFPTGTTQYEKRNIALQIPVWDTDACIQCGKCSIVCPHAAIRLKVYDKDLLAKMPPKFKSAARQGQGVRRDDGDHPDSAGRLHGVPGVRQQLPGAEEGRRGQAHGQARDQHGSPAAAEGAGAGELGVLPDAAREPTPRRSTRGRSREASSGGRSSSSRARARAAARRRTSSS